MGANDTLLIVGYGSLLSGHGLLTVRRQGKSRLYARQAFPLTLTNARRGLAKPTSHGHYLAMDIEPLDPTRPIQARHGRRSAANEFGALGLEFERRWARDLARREEYDPDVFEELIARADRAGQTVGEYLLAIARASGFEPLAYRRALAQRIGYTSPGYIFHPLPLDDGQVALIAIGSGFEGSGDPAVPSRRQQAVIANLMTLPQAMKFTGAVSIDPASQLGYFVECLLGGMHGLWVSDLLAGLEEAPELRSALSRVLAETAATEREHFLAASGLSLTAYRERFGAAEDRGLAALLRVDR
ncbi:MAG TPA: hypothetical protein VKV28_13095 [Candidatus Binataceae bacterium]|nr:hypothetical protein [Candidatus Binataceae bacterium]